VRKLPRSILVVGALFIAVGVLDVYRGLAPLLDRAGTPRLASDDVQVLAIGAAAIVGGGFLLRGRNWARWLLAAWMGLHVALSAAHPSELAAHGAIFAVLLFFLFRPAVAPFFRQRDARQDG
jgi:hypothetical protein